MRVNLQEFWRALHGARRAQIIRMAVSATRHHFLVHGHTEDGYKAPRATGRAEWNRIFLHMLLLMVWVRSSFFHEHGTES